MSKLNTSTRISKLLLENGFIQWNVINGEIVKATRAETISSQINRGKTVPFVKKIKLSYICFWKIEVDFLLNFKPKRNKSIVGKLLENAMSYIKTGGGSVHDVLFYSLVEFERDQGLYKYLDIYLFNLKDIIFNGRRKKLLYKVNN